MIHGYRALFVFSAAASMALSVPKVFAAECEGTFAKIALHLASPTSKAIPCGLANISCSYQGGVVTDGELEQVYTAYVFLANWGDGYGVQQVQIGAHYDGTLESGVDVLSFQSCASWTSPIGVWPEPGSELVMGWDACQNAPGDELLVLGYFGLVAHTPGTFSVTNLFGPSPQTVPRLVDCGGTERIIEPFYVSRLAFGESEYPFDTCSAWIDVFPAPCCLVDSCMAPTSLGCCWANGGTLLNYDSSCASCVTPLSPKTWGQLKSRYE